LLCLKLAQLAAVRALTEVIVDSNDEEVLELAERARRTWPSESKLTVRRRPDVLGSASTTTDELIAYALETIAAETLLWTHVTSPMVDASVYERACETFRARSDECDSLMSVHRLQTFLWNEHGPVNYDPAMLRWPRTQDLPPLFAVDSAILSVRGRLFSS
jgi:CMP-N-acetylneuraminic acid synthetase